MLFFKVMFLCNASTSNDKVLACCVLERINNKNNRFEKFSEAGSNWKMPLFQTLTVVSEIMRSLITIFIYKVNVI